MFNRTSIEDLKSDYQRLIILFKWQHTYPKSYLRIAAFGTVTLICGLLLQQPYIGHPGLLTPVQMFFVGFVEGNF